MPTPESRRRRDAGRLGPILKKLAVELVPDPSDELMREKSHIWWADSKRGATLLRSSARPSLISLIDTMRSTEDARLKWGQDKLEDFAYEVLAEMAQGRLRTGAAAAELMKMLGAVPDDYTTVFSLYGLRLGSDDLRLCGVTLTRDIDGAVRRLSEGKERREWERLIRGELDSFKDGAIVISVLAADDVRGFQVARARCQVLMCVAVLAERRDRDWPYWEINMGFEATPHSAVLGRSKDALGLGQSARGFGTRGVGADTASVNTQLSSRPGLAALDSLAARTPSVRSRGDGRLLRACSCLANSLQGDLPTRFLWRWMGMEALLGDEQGTVSERLIERLAVATSLAGDRLERKHWLRALYRQRNELAHGGIHPTVSPSSSVKFRDVVFGTLETVAFALERMTDTELFEVLERAKFDAKDLWAWLV